jgi:hypothetical protein
MTRTSFRIGWLPFALLLLAAGAPARSQQAAPTKDLPRASVKELVFDAGKVVRGDPVKHDFIVENAGAAALEITRVQPACGCTVAQYDAKIEPGKAGKISATLATAGFSGPIHKTISVTTNDPRLASFQLALKADVRSILTVLPSETQQLGLAYQGQALEKSFTITADDGTPFQIKSVECQDPALAYDLSVAKDQKSAVLKVILPPSHPAGLVTGRFTLATTYPKVPSLHLNVFGTVREALTIQPKEVVYSGLSASWMAEHPEDAALSRTVTVAYDQAPELEVKSATSNLDNLEVSVSEIEPKKRFTVALKLKPPMKAGDFSGLLSIETSEKTLTVPVRGTIF